MSRALVLAKKTRYDEGLSTKPRPKALADGPVVQDILRYLWVHDEFDYQHPRMRVQLTLAVYVLHYLGLRPGELVESSAHTGSNQGLWYKDLTVFAYPDTAGRARSVVQPTIRNRKNRRDREDLE
ncbi:hypothetical protein B0A54_17771 [Friedmanniomyces endolithicus]|uniref:Tyr recombinase domain-containing protein n=1 Tax=Friedmanniomyces endolithicus TaxID=329885 RepID=A0A4U0TNI2_9PEZI|nr:hypothetical protein B0A54_17771 [Friedmanniomyces endolithicus]